eukprot:767779-Hanusia_phi.AAC.10
MAPCIPMSPPLLTPLLLSCISTTSPRLSLLQPPSLPSSYFEPTEGKRLVHVLCHGSHVESRLSLIAPGEDRHALHQRPKHAIRADLRRQHERRDETSGGERRSREGEEDERGEKEGERSRPRRKERRRWMIHLRSVPFGVHVRQCRPAAALGEQLGPHLPSRGANVTDLRGPSAAEGAEGRPNHAEPSSRTGQEGVWLDLRRRSAEMVQEDKRAGGVGKRRKVVVGEAPEHCRVPDRDPEALGMDMVLPCVGD